ncbi:MAG: S-layer homology domain-containing protein [Sporomusaceae bacterium]|jgi:hypothetical protein|nr:S-layer homology domain-containing protein [Sporomusaceae bacterium]
MLKGFWKKELLAVITLAAFLCPSIAFASNNMFSDVTKDDWSYQAVKELAAQEIISGDEDTALRNGRTLTRYKIAQLVANAITKADTVSPENRAVIDRLANEYTNELQSLGVIIKPVATPSEPAKVEPPQEKPGGWKVSGVFKYRYEYVRNARPLLADKGAPIPSIGRADDKGNNRLDFGIMLDNQFDGDTYFHALIASESLSGRTNKPQLELREAHVMKRFPSGNEVGVGRFIADNGLGTIAGGPWMDGIKLALKGEKINSTLYVTKFGDDAALSLVEDPATGEHHYMTEVTPKHTFYQGDVKFDLAKNTKMSLAFLVDKESAAYNSKAVGLVYTGIRDWTLSGEYAINSADHPKNPDLSGESAKAGFIKAKYRGANPMVPGSQGFWVQYKKADPGFDSLGLASPFTWITPFNYSSPSGGGFADNIKGYEFGYERTIFSRTIFSLIYNKAKRVANAPMSLSGDIHGGKENQDYFITQVQYFF